MFYQQYDAQCKGYCVNAAGVVSADAPFSSEYNRPEGITNLFPSWPDFLGLTRENDGNGNHFFDAHVGLPGFDGGAGFHAYSDGFTIGFVPVQSALDYGTLNSPQPNIMSSSVTTATKMNNTPFDVIIGMDHAIDPTTEKNWPHLNIRNDPLNYCLACSNHIYSYILNREIGDEDMYVDNMILPRISHFEAERNMKVNVFNPNYSYPTISSSPMDGMYSKENGLQIIYTPTIQGFGIFQYDSGKSGVFVYNNCNANTCSSLVATITPCCINYSARQIKQDNLIINDIGVRLLAFPNPSTGHGFSLKHDLTDEDLNLQIFSSLGEKVFDKRVVNSQSLLVFENLDLRQGIYLIKLCNNYESLQTKIIVNY